MHLFVLQEKKQNQHDFYANYDTASKTTLHGGCEIKNFANLIHGNEKYLNLRYSSKKSITPTRGLFNSYNTKTESTEETTKPKHGEKYQKQNLNNATASQIDLDDMLDVNQENKARVYPYSTSIPTYKMDFVSRSQINNLYPHTLNKKIGFRANRVSDDKNCLKSSTIRLNSFRQNDSIQKYGTTRYAGQDEAQDEIGEFTNNYSISENKSGNKNENATKKHDWRD